MSQPYILTGTLAYMAFFGLDRPANDREIPLKYAGVDPNKICLVKAAGKQSDPGFMELIDPIFGHKDKKGFDVFADLVWVNELGSVVIMKPADCPVFAMSEINTGMTIMGHAGRSAVAPQNKKGEPIVNVITKAYSAITFGVAKPEVEVFISASICGNCFEHNWDKDRHILEPFDQFGDSVAFNSRSRGSLHLLRIIFHQLIGLGVQANKIRYDKRCTHENKKLASYRRDKSEARNLAMVVRR